MWFIKKDLNHLCLWNVSWPPFPFEVFKNTVADLSFVVFFFFLHRKIFLTLIIFGTQQSYLLHQFLISFTFICQFFVPVNSRFVCKQTLNNLNCESDIPVFFFFNFYFTDWKILGRHFSQLWIEKWKFRDLHNFIGRNLGLSTGSVKETS